MRRKIWLPLVLIVLAAVGGLAATLIGGNSPELGLDLQGGVSVVLAPTKKASGEQLDQSLEIIRSRVDALGVAEPDITRQGNAIVVQLPGVKNRDRALELVGQTAELRFRPVLADLSGADIVNPDENATSTTTGSGSTTTTTAPPTTTTTPGKNQVTLTSRVDDKPDATVTLAGKDSKTAYRLGPSLATGRIVSSAHAEIPQGQWQVQLNMKGGKNGIDKFNEIAAQCHPASQVCPTGQLAIVLDSVVQSAPVIQESNFQKDQIRISGSFTESEAKNLALVLRYGSLPVELERQSVQTVSASLGTDSLHAGIVAGIVGLSLVALYMLLYYRALGLVVIVGLGVSGALLYTIVTWLGHTQGLALTLSGVTGIIVSIGVTVDSYVVFFERLKDEVKAGRTLRSSTERAFKRAFRTILAADTSSFLGAAVLWWLTVGSVRGFAFFLGLSTVLDVIVAWCFTRPVVSMLAQNPLFTEMPVFGVARGLAAAPTRPRTAPAGGTGR